MLLHNAGCSAIGQKGGGGESGIGARHATAGFFDGAHAPVAFAHQGYWNA
ncbi:hypothetical protein [Acetobacter syzygii]|nr:hypothetical protein [Acetobacter syzygii]NSL91301.1 hypothetical protein [Acetobacter syzygii]